MDYAVDIGHLSEKFFEDYPVEQYPEIAYNKKGRPYTCLLIETHEGYIICIPFRSHIRHKQAFLFKTTKRSQNSASGLDFSKIVICNNPQYIIPGAVIDHDEYVEMIKNCDTIVSKADKYINTYLKHITKEKELGTKAFDSRYKYTTLKYFHNLLLNETTTPHN